MVRVNLKRRSGDTHFLLVYLKKKSNSQSQVCNCAFNCCEVSLSPSAPLHPLAAITLPLPHAGRIPSAIKAQGTLTARCSLHPVVYPKPWEVICASVPIRVHLWSPQHPWAHRLQSHWPQEPVLLFTRNETQNQKSFSQPFISLLLPLIIRHNHLCGAAPSPRGSYPEATWTWEEWNQRCGWDGMRCCHGLLAICLSLQKGTAGTGRWQLELKLFSERKP